MLSLLRCAEVEVPLSVCHLAGIESRLRHLRPVELVLPTSALSAATETIIREWMGVDGSWTSSAADTPNTTPAATPSNGEAPDPKPAQQVASVRVERAADEWFDKAMAAASIVETFSDIGASDNGSLPSSQDSRVSSAHTAQLFQQALELKSTCQAALGALARHLQVFKLTRLLRAAGTRSLVPCCDATAWLVTWLKCRAHAELVPFSSHGCVRLPGATLHDLEVFTATVGGSWGLVVLLQLLHRRCGCRRLVTNMARCCGSCHTAKPCLGSGGWHSGYDVHLHPSQTSRPELRLWRS